MFNNSRLLDCVAYGSQFAHEFSTRIETLRSGVERRNADWDMPRFKFSVLYQNLKQEDHDKVYFAHMACRGSLIPFRFRDWRDYRAENQILGYGTGVPETLQLFKTYTFGAVELTRIISKPTFVQVFADGDLISSSFDELTGLFTFAADEGAVISATFEFDVPVRFVSDSLSSDAVSKSGEHLILSADVDLIEVKGE